MNHSKSRAGNFGGFCEARRDVGGVATLGGAS